MEVEMRELGVSLILPDEVLREVLGVEGLTLSYVRGFLAKEGLVLAGYSLDPANNKRLVLSMVPVTIESIPSPQLQERAAAIPIEARHTFETIQKVLRTDLYVLAHSEGRATQRPPPALN